MNHMETVYVDPASWRCSRTAQDGALAVETDVFLGRCDAFVEGCILVPHGCSLALADGRTLPGEMMTPWKPYAGLDEAQRAYERAQYEAARAAYAALEEGLGAL